ncbi:MAG: hypothetical protein Q7S22_05675 [Candidatus Micrarchaeota archaeon]|nr:hypothetical protein [Candidatus Micrarchaeota archaeon]
MVDSLTALYSSWSFVAVILVVISTVLVSLVYMFGSVLVDDKMKLWAKLELFEIFYSLILLAAVFSWIGMFDSVAYGILHDSSGSNPSYLTQGFFPDAANPGKYVTQDICSFAPGTNYDRAADPLALSSVSPYADIPHCHIRLSIYYLNTIFQETSNVAFKIYQSYMITSTIADFAINIEFVTDKAGFFTITPWRGFFTMGNAMKTAGFDFAMKMMTLTKFQEILIAFVSKALFPNLFIVGLVLRTFSFTRRLGGLLMAIALALFYIFPMFYVFGAMLAISIQHAAYLGPDNIPSIADHLYINGKVPLLTGSYDLNQQQLDYYSLVGVEPQVTRDKIADGASPDGYFPSVNLNLPNGDADLTARTNQLSDADLKELQGVGTTFTGNLGKKKFYDNFVSISLEDGGVMDVVSRLTFFSVFFSFFGVLATIAAIRSISITLGGDVEIAGLTHLI